MAEYISREDVTERLTEIFKLQAETAKAIVEAIPAADVVERKKGKWISNALNREKTKTNWYCSECGNGVVCRDQFCSNCGADMRGEGDV